MKDRLHNGSAAPRGGQYTIHFGGAIDGFVEDIIYHLTVE